MKQNNKILTQELCAALVKINNTDIMYRFLKDLITPRELKLFARRWQICTLLAKNISHRDISFITGASTSTITRVARFLKKEHYKGYKEALQIPKINEDSQSLS